MNRERLTILRDHLASLPDERVDMMNPDPREHECGSPCCIGGWANRLFSEQDGAFHSLEEAADILSLTNEQHGTLFYANNTEAALGDLTRTDAIAAIQSMLDSPDDDALPVWPERAEAA